MDAEKRSPAGSRAPREPGQFADLASASWSLSAAIFLGHEQRHVARRQLRAVALLELGHLRLGLVQIVGRLVGLAAQELCFGPALQLVDLLHAQGERRRSGSAAAPRPRPRVIAGRAGESGGDAVLQSLNFCLSSGSAGCARRLLLEQLELAGLRFQIARRLLGRMSSRNAMPSRLCSIIEASSSAPWPSATTGSRVAAAIARKRRRSRSGTHRPVDLSSFLAHASRLVLGAITSRDHGKFQPHLRDTSPRRRPHRSEPLSAALNAALPHGRPHLRLTLIARLALPPRSAGRGRWSAWRVASRPRAGVPTARGLGGALRPDGLLERTAYAGPPAAISWRWSDRSSGSPA